MSSSSPPPHAPYADAEWVACVRRGDRAAFEALFRTYFASLWRFAMRYVGRSDVAEDVVHDVFAQLWMTRAEWTVRDTVRTYLLRAVRNRTINVYKHEQMTRARGAAVDATERAGIAHVGRAEDEILDDASQRALARELVDALPEPRRSAVILRYYEELSFAEIAAVLETSVGAAEMLVARAVRSLQRGEPSTG